MEPQEELIAEEDERRVGIRQKKRRRKNPKRTGRFVSFRSANTKKVRASSPCDTKRGAVRMIPSEWFEYSR